MKRFIQRIQNITFVLLLFVSFSTAAQNDTNEVNLLVKKSLQLRKSHPDSAVIYSTRAITIAEKINFTRGLILGYRGAGLAYIQLNNYDKALACLAKCLNIAKSTGNKRLIGDGHFYLSQVYRFKSNYGLSVNACFKALELYEAENYEEGVANCYNGIANVYYDQQNHAKALEYFLKTEKSMGKSSETNKSVVYQNLGLAYSDVKKFDSAMYYYNKSLEIRQRTNDKFGIADVYTNMGVSYSLQGNYPKALEYLFKSAETYKDLPNPYYEGIIFTNVGDIYLNMNNYKEAEKYLLKGLEMAEKIDDKEGIKTSSGILANLYSTTKEWEKAFIYNRRYIAVKDTLSSQKNLNLIQDIETKYETDKLDREIELLNKDKLLQDSIIEKQNAQRIAFVSVILFLIGISFIIFRSYNQKKRDNEIITRQKEEVEKKNHIIEEQKRDVEEKQKEILDSIHYAERIQRTLLPAEKLIQKNMDRMKKNKL